MDNPYEIVGTAFGLLSVWLTVRRSVWCWPTGLVNVVCFFVMFYQVKLYAELITYAVFFVLGVYGWWTWSRGEDARAELPITRTPRAVAAVLIGLALAVDVLGIGVYLVKGLYATTALYAVFLVLATSGLVAWWRALDAERTGERAPA